MRTLKRNKQTFWYANITDTQQIIDYDTEYETGETYIGYSEPVAVNANISAARGTADLDAFGIGANYSKTIVTDDITLPIYKSTILWVDNEPDEYGEAGEIKHDYVVVAVARSLNSLTIAIKEVSVS